MWPAVMAAGLVALLGGAVLWWGTDGGQALTAETARRLDIAAKPRLLPDVPLSDSEDHMLNLGDYRGAPVVLEFIYATCPDICLVLGTSFEQIDAQASADTQLLSISFDPADDAETLGWFAERHGAAAPRWRVAGVSDSEAREALLQKAEVIAVPDGLGGYVHNAGLYVVDADGRLTEVLDAEDVEGALLALERLAD